MYALVNFFVPAVVLVSILDRCKLLTNFFTHPWYIQIALLYITGVTLSRIGSLIVQPIMEMLKIINMSEYKKYLKYSDDAVKKMQRTANEYRTYTALFFILMLTLQNDITILWLFLTLLFAISYKKQLGYIQKRLVYNANKEEL